MSAHVDTFARDHLPPRDQWPEFLYDLPELRYPAALNCAAELLEFVQLSERADDTVEPHRSIAFVPVE